MLEGGAPAHMGGLPTFKIGRSRISIAFLGYALILFWFSSVGMVGIADDLPSDRSLCSMLSMATDAIVLIAMGCLSSKVHSLRSRGRVFLIACITVVSTVFAFVVASERLPVAVNVIGSCFAGVAKALTSLMWMEAFCALGMRGAAVAFTTTSLLGSLIRIVMPPMGVVPELILAVVAGVAGVLLAPHASHPDELTTGDEAGTELDGRRWSFPLQPTVLMGVYAFAYTFILNAGFAQGQEISLQRFADVTVFACVLVAVLVAFSRFDVKALSVVAVPLVCAGLLCALGSFSQCSLAAVPLVALGFYCMSTFIYLLLFNISFRYDVNPLWLFGFSRAARVVGTLCASMVTNGFDVRGPSEACDLVVGSLLVIVVAVAMTLAAGRGFATTWGIHTIHGATGVSGDTALSSSTGLTFESRLEYVAYMCGLTKREEEVLGLLTRGMSVPDIERELLISNGTVRNHVQHVYKKLGVHSREEVRAFMADPRSRMSAAVR